MGVAAAFDDHRRSVRFFCDWGRFDLARARIFEDAEPWARLDDWGAERATDHLSEEQPLAAIVVLRGLVRHAWEAGDPVYQPRIPGWIRKLARLASRVESDNSHRREGVSSHAAFLQMIGMTPDGKRR